MSELEEKLSSLLSNPQLMQQISSMAQSMTANQQNHPPAPAEVPQGSLSLPDPKLMEFFAQSMKQSGVDSNQQALLHALSPYLSDYRVHKLERAMRAAKLAGTASLFLNSGGLQMLSGR